jgi:hypothetical protein
MVVATANRMPRWFRILITRDYVLVARRTTVWWWVDRDHPDTVAEVSAALRPFNRRVEH